MNSEELLRQSLSKMSPELSKEFKPILDDFIILKHENIALKNQIGELSLARVRPCDNELAALKEENSNLRGEIRVLIDKTIKEDFQPPLDKQKLALIKKILSCQRIIQKKASEDMSDKDWDRFEEANERLWETLDKLDKTLGGK